MLIVFCIDLQVLLQQVFFQFMVEYFVTYIPVGVIVSGLCPRVDLRLFVLGKWVI